MEDDNADNYTVYNICVKIDMPFKPCVTVIDKENDSLTYVWEVLKEATVLGFGSSYITRPERVSDVVTSEENICETTICMPSEYRRYVYVLDNTGFVSTSNVTFQVIK